MVLVGYHCFEPIGATETFDWKYRQSILNELDASESNILSVASNQRIIHDFLQLRQNSHTGQFKSNSLVG
jgi:heme oxygenase